jgi:carbon storage regulator
MLVLSRKETQRIRLGDSIVVTVVRVSGDKVRLGIEAPADMLVLRDELEPRTEGVGTEGEGVNLAELTVELDLSGVAEESVPRQQLA